MIPPPALSRMLSCAVSWSRFRVTGDSMAPTLRDGQQVLAVPLQTEDCRLPRGALVVLRHPVTGEEIYIKRIVGLPGEHLRIEKDGIYVNDSLLPEPYLPSVGDMPGPCGSRRDTARLWVTDTGEYFVMGDRRGDSQDSRSFGPVPLRCILGRVWLRCWPPRAWGVLDRE